MPRIVPLIAICLAVILASCAPALDEETQIRRAIADAAYCESDTDCTLLAGQCPFGCYIAVNPRYAAEIQQRVDAYESQCVYSCLACEAAACVNNVCTTVCEGKIIGNEIAGSELP